MIDLLIIGSGGAGLSAAISAKEKGADVLVVTKQHPSHAQTVQAQGGINSVLSSENDSIENHISDTLRSSHGLGKKSSIELMCSNGKDTIAWLDSIGVPFSRDENNQIAQRKFGGTKFRRTCYSSDYTGLKILHTLYDKAIKEDVKFLNEHLLLDIIVSKGRALGAVFLDIVTGELKQILAKSTILATGGYAGLYNGYTTNSNASTGDGIAAAFRAGCYLKNMEFIQFHPTALKNSRALISESARGEGGYLLNSNGERFVDELLPRDKVSRAIFEQLQDGKSVYLDIRHLGLEKIMQTMPQERELAKIFENVDVESELIPIEPVAHYSMGGIKTDINTKTNIDNLYACGECAEVGVHGANRLGGNSLLEIVSFGRISGVKAYEALAEVEEKEYDIYIKDKEYIESIYTKENKINFYNIKEELGKLFYSTFGLSRQEESMNRALEDINLWKEEFSIMGIDDKSKNYNQNLVELIEFKNLLDLSTLISKCAINRKESRGAHSRADYKDEEKKYLKDSITYMEKGNVVLKFVECEG
ncbi:MAG: FAD-dependent oxidoreductase [Sphaerochaetaceae bacterium]|nr:FAD-dependent oxidoreductase [Sphaerochaetaceae bacterium]